MEHINKKNSLETAKNRLYISGLTYIDGTRYVYDKIIKNPSSNLVNYMPLVESSNGYVLRYKNLIKQYYWLINEFIPSCSYEKLCIRNGEKTWLQYENACEALMEYVTFSFYDDNNLLIASTSVVKGNLATPFTPNKTGYNFDGWLTELGGNTFYDFYSPVTEDTNVYTKYTIKIIELTFRLNNGDPDAIIQVDYGTSAGDIREKLADEGIIPQKIGYTFNDWYPEIVTAINNTSYDATYFIDLYVIRFFNLIDSEHVIDQDKQILPQPINGGSRTEYTIIKTETHNIGEPSEYYTTTPTYQHFNFVEWIDANGDAISNERFEYITEDIDAYPRLEKKEYTVIFLDWDNTQLSEQIVEYLDEATEPETPHRDNYEFTGWDTVFSSITNDTVVHAVYEGEEITVNYLLQDENHEYVIYSSITTTFNSTAPFILPPNTEDYPPVVYGLFDGWYSDEEHTTAFDFSDLLESDTNIYGKWKTEFAVYFYNWDGTLISGSTPSFQNPVYVNYGDDVPDEALDEIISAMNDKPGYDFLGWNKSTENITYDVNITAVFSDVKICLVRFINSEDSTIISSVTVEFGGTILKSDYPEAPEVEHKTFSYWQGNTSEIFDDVDVFAIYNFADLTVKFVDFNNNVLGTQTVKYGETGSTPYYTVVDVAARLDPDNNPEVISELHFNGTYCYVRDEFDTETECLTPEEKIITDDNTIFAAQYDVIATAITTCNIRFYNYDSAYWLTDTVLYGTVMDSAYSQDILNIFIEQGQEYSPDPETYEFYGWADEYGNEYIIGQNELTVTHDINLYAKYKMISYTVQFYVQSNPDYYPNIIDMPIRSLETDVIKNNALNRPFCYDVPERVYFETFCDGLNNRWYIDSACTQEWIFKQDVQFQPIPNPMPVTGDMILYGKYIGREYTLTYDTNGGSSITQETYRYPSPTIIPEQPTKAGSTFVGWYTDDETFENEFVFGEPLTDNITIHAKWFDAPVENTIIYKAYADIRSYMPDMGNSHIIQEACVWDVVTDNGILVYDSPIETFNIGVLNSDESVTVNNEIKRNLISITIPKNVTDVVTGQFVDCRYLEEIKVDESNRIYLSNDGVLVKIPSRVLRLTTYECYPQAKTNNYSFTFFRTSNGTAIGNLSFANCKHIKDVVFESYSNIFIGEKAFLNCSGFKKITIYGDGTRIEVENNSFDGVDTSGCELYVPCNDYEYYSIHEVWSQFEIKCHGTVLHLSDSSTVIIEDDILTHELISDVYSGTVVSCEIGNNVTEISESAFWGCNALTSVTIPNSVTNIGGGAFNRCESLTSVIIPGSVESIGEGAFALCTSLTNVELQDGISLIGDGAFGMCSDLAEIYIPYTVRTIRRTAFSECPSLRSITMDAVTPAEFGQDVFDGSNCPIYVPCDSVDAYKAVPSLIEYENRIQCHGQDEKFVTFTAQESNSTIGLQKLSSYQTLEYSTDGSSWDTMTTASTITLTNSGDSCYIRGILSADNIYYTNYTRFKMTGKISASGNCNYLWNYENPDAQLKKYCGYRMFYGCSGLTTAPVLPATTLLADCYNSMFSDCAGLTTAPELPATTLANGCYHYMFDGCAGLTTAPVLPATTLAGNCYEYMFKGCTRLTTAPELPATTLADYCYHGMFNGCTSLTTAPVLPATTLAGNCYHGMFNGCTSLTTAPVLPATTLAYGCYHYMFDGCAGLTTAPVLPATTLADYCYHGMFNGCTSLTTAPVLPATTLLSDCYNSMFSDCAGLTTAPELPATTLANGCYNSMFWGCSGLTTAPELPATALTQNCYSGMFNGCTSLTTAPELPATTLADYCYYGMFNGCTSLTTAPELPATTLADYCYHGMFNGCTSLTTAPVLPATTLAVYCYYGMFSGCTIINRIKCLAINGINQDFSTNSWVKGVASTGTFVKHPNATTWPTSINGIPTGWVVEDDDNVLP